MSKYLMNSIFVFVILLFLGVAAKTIIMRDLLGDESGKYEAKYWSSGSEFANVEIKDSIAIVSLRKGFKGLEWSYNDTLVSFVDSSSSYIHRMIKKKGWKNSQVMVFKGDDGMYINHHWEGCLVLQKLK